MDLEGMIDKIPSTEKILGVVWIISWICAIWVYHIQFFLTGVFCLFLIFILLDRFEKKENNKIVHHKPMAIFSMDQATKTLTVQKIYDNNIKWDEHEICSGNAILPNGIIKKGDTIKNCEGNLALRHVPSNRIFGAYNFEE